MASSSNTFAASTSTNNEPASNSKQQSSSQVMDPEDYGDMHRIVLQAFLQVGHMNAQQVKSLFRSAAQYLKCTLPEGSALLPFIQRLTRKINLTLEPYAMVIKSAVCEISGEKFYMFYFTNPEQQIGTMHTKFTKPEMGLYWRILDYMLGSTQTFTVSKAECMNIAMKMQLRGFTAIRATSLMNCLIDVKYFVKVPNETNPTDFGVTLGVRTLRVFEPIFRTEHPDIFVDCSICKGLLLNGLQCPKCVAVVHRACLRKYIKQCKECLVCKAVWKKEKALRVRVKPQEQITLHYEMAEETEEENEKNGTVLVSGQVNQDQGGQQEEEEGEFAGMPVLEPVYFRMDDDA